MNETSRRSARIEYLAAGALLAYLLVAITLVYWAVARAPALAERGDNPRLVEAELRIRRGRILDANGVVLAETIGAPDDPLRLYPISSIGPAVGYYSFRHGTAGIEEGYDDVLRGESDVTWEAFWRRTLHRTQTGQDVRLTLDAELQRYADDQLGELSGALLILSVPDGAVKAMVSHPGYDPNRLDELFEELAAESAAPLLNRVTQGQYQPGLALQPFILAWALDQGLLRIQDEAAGGAEPIMIRDQLKGCRETPPAEVTWTVALQYACPAPMLSLSEELSTDELMLSFERFGLLGQPDFPMATIASDPQPVSEVEEAILGQESLTVTPLQMARAWVALAGEGALPNPYLVSDVQNSAGVWQSVEAANPATQAVAPTSAAAILASLASYDGVLLEHSTAALSGPEAARNGWYLGLIPAQAPQYAVVVVIEGAADASSAQNIGRSVLEFAWELE